MKLKKNIIIHPLLIGLYSPLALLAINIAQIELLDSLRSILVSLVFVFLSWGAGALIYRNRYRAAMFSSLFLVLFFSYGHMYPFIEKLTIFGVLIGRHRNLLLFNLVIFIAGGFLILRVKNGRNISNLLNFVTAMTLIVPIFQITFTNNDSAQGFTANEISNMQSVASQLAVPKDHPLPDVYVLLMDTYARDDIIKRDYQFDNSAFINSLKSKGFVVPPCARSNYPKTELSIASFLNMDYIQNIAPHVVGKNDNPRQLAPYLKNSSVRFTLQDLGYQFITFDSTYPVVNITDSDVYYEVPHLQLQDFIDPQKLGKFDQMFAYTTPLLAFEPKLDTWFESLNARKTGYHYYLKKVYSLDKLDETPFLTSPKFVFAHMTTTHPFFVFDPDGSYRYRLDKDDMGYINAITYANSRILRTIDLILKNSKTPPVILLLGDHGRTFTPDRVLNLTAYYLPEGGAKQMYDTITPVNVFRIVFNQYFGGKLPLLPDISYDSPQNKVVLTALPDTSYPECRVDK